MAWEFDWLLAIQQIRSGFLDIFMRILSTLGDGGIFWILCGIVLFAYPRTRKVGITVILSMSLSFILGNLILKTIINRSRPYEVMTELIPLVRKPHDSSFPSGHTLNSFTSSVAILCHNRKWGIPAVILAFGIGFSRMYNLVHFPTDVLAGMILGTIVAITVYFFLKKRAEKKENENVTECK